jgi:SAM-dependent methyltransferase
MSPASRLLCSARRLKCRFKGVADRFAPAPVPAETPADCPVCATRVDRVLRYPAADYVSGPSAARREVRTPCKYLCPTCGHLFTPWLDGDIAAVGDAYQGIYAGDALFQENARAAYQRGLIEYALRHLPDRPRPAILDFGCGPNLSPARHFRALGLDARGCDILPGYPYDGRDFFRYDPDDASRDGQFDVIVSIDVIEHLGDTARAWTRLNRLLRPGGVMAHSFPSRLHYGLMHAHCAAPFHTCLFTRDSLQRLASRHGFAWEAVEPFPAGVPFVFRFRKTASV